MTMYVLLNLAVLAMLLILPVLMPVRLNWRGVWITFAIMLVATIVFDSLIIASKIVAYDMDLILGLYIGKAPIEDFAYMIAAALFVPYLWERFGKK